MTSALATSPTRVGDEELRVTMAAANIFDLFMGGDTSWRERADMERWEGDLFDSADWQTAVSYARAALRASGAGGGKPDDMETTLAALERIGRDMPDDLHERVMALRDSHPAASSSVQADGRGDEGVRDV